MSLDRFVMGSSTRMHLLGCVVALLGLVSCGNEASKVDVPSTDSVNGAVNSKEMLKAKQILFSLPSPSESAVLIKSSNAAFDLNYLNQTSNVSRYTSNESKALNLGVYGTDLIYTNVYGQTQESTEYFKCANALSKALGINDAFGESTFKRIKSNVDNKDSLLSIIAEASMEADAYFKENERPASSALVATGGWLEGLYIATRIGDNTKNKAVLQRVAEQKNSAGNLIALVESFGSEKELASILQDLRELKLLFDALQVKEDAFANTGNTAEKQDVKVVGKKKHIEMTPEQFRAIADKVEQIRNRIIK